MPAWQSHSLNSVHDSTEEAPVDHTRRGLLSSISVNISTTAVMVRAGHILPHLAIPQVLTSTSTFGSSAARQHRNRTRMRPRA